MLLLLRSLLDAVAPPPEPPSENTNNIGGGGRGRSEENLIAQVLDKWSYIEAAQKRDAQKRQAAKKPIDAIDVQPPLEQPVVFKALAIGIPHPIPAFDAAPVPRIGGALAPDMAERARRMRERDEEEALVMILLQALD